MIGVQDGCRSGIGCEGCMFVSVSVSFFVTVTVTVTVTVAFVE